MRRFTLPLARDTSTPSATPFWMDPSFDHDISALEHPFLHHRVWEGRPGVEAYRPVEFTASLVILPVPIGRSLALRLVVLHLHRKVEDTE